CDAPTHLEITNIHGSSAMVNWTSAQLDVTDYTVEYSEAGQGNWQSMVVSGNQVMLTGLTETTSYDVMLYSNCSNGSSDTLTAEFTTGCLAGGSLQIGEGTGTTYYIPLNNYYNYTYTQQIFLASEMSGATDIRSISFDYAYATASTDKNNVNIYLGHTTQSSFSGTGNYIPDTVLHLVYSGHLNCQQGWNEFTLDSVFHYNGTDNLVLAVDDNSGDYNGSAYTFHTHTTTDSRSLYYYSDSNNPSPSDPTASSTNSYTNTIRNNVIFGGDCDLTATCIAPNVYVSSVDAQSVTVAWAPGASESSWELEYKDEASTTWTSVGSVTASPYVLDNLTSATTYQIRLRSDCGGEYSEWSTVTATIPCFVLSLPYTENFDNATGSGSSHTVPCWTKTTNYSTAYPYPYSTYNHSAPYSLYFYGTSSYYSMAVSPRFDDSIEMDSLQISFWSYKTSSSYFIEVGIVSDPDDISTFELIGTFSPSATSTWEKAEFKTDSYNGNGHYVAFRIPQWTTSYQYLDDVTIDYIPACLHVENLAATNITAYSADITWTPGANEDSWEILYGTDVDFSVDQPMTVFNTTETLTNLNPNTQYEVYVRGNCASGDHSSWEYITFRTGCVPITSVPYMEDFDSYSGSTTTSVSANNLPNCWSNYNTGSSTTYSGYPIIYNSSSYANSGSNVMRFYTYSSSTYGDQYAILPEIDTTILPLNTVRLSFSARALSTSYTFQLIVGVALNNMPSSFIPLDTVNITSTTHNDYHLTFPNFAGGGDRFVLLAKKPTSGYNYGYVDDIKIDFPPSCSAPTDFAVGTVTSTTVDLTWNDTISESSWQLVIVEEGQTPDFTQPLTVSSTNYTATGLSANTHYTFYVRTECSSGLGFSDWADVEAWTISSNPAQTPYNHDFSDALENDEWVLVNGTQSNKWYIAQPTGETDTMMFVSSDGLSTNYNISSASNVWTYRDIQFGTGAEFSLSFSWRGHGESCCDYLRAYIGTPMPVTAGSITAPDGAVQIGANMNMQDTWQTVTYMLDASYQNTTKRIYFLWHNDGSVGTAPAGMIDNITISVSDCGRPYDLAATNLGTTSFDLTFSPALATDNAWEYVVCTPGTNPDNEVPVSITGTTASVSGLTAATTYNVYVKTVCASGGYSAWSDPLTVTTNCDAIATLPYSEAFDTYGSGTTAYPTCWRKINTYSSDRPYISTTHYSGVGSLYFYAGSGTYNMAITPQFDATIGINTLQATFMYRAMYASDRLIVGVMTDPMDASTFVPVDTVYPAATPSTWAEQTVIFNQYSGTGQYIAFKNEYTTQSAYAYVDDLFIETIPTCVRPASISVSSVTDNSAEISWVTAGTESAWNVEYKEASATTWTVVPVTTNPYTLTGLTAGTAYDVRVQADCGAGDVSTYRESSFQTEACAPSSQCTYVFNMTDSYGDGWNDAYINIVQNGVTVATAGENFTTGTSYTQNVALCDNISTTLVWVSGDFDDECSFTVTDPSGTTIYTSVYEPYGTLTTFTTDCGGTTTPCDAPTGLAVNNVTQTTATASWTAGGTETSWNVQYKAAADATWQSATANTTSYTMTGLTPGTNYQVKVQAVCDASTTSDWTTAVSFTTPNQDTPTCPAPTDLAATVDHTDVTLTWQQEANTATEWQINYRQTTESTWSTATATTTSYTLTDLVANVTYEANVVAHCTNGLNSDPSNTVTFETNNIGVQTYLEKSVNLYPNPATEIVSVAVSDASIQISSVEVYNVYGQLINVIESNDNPLRINVSGLADGMYYVRVTTDNGVVTKNFVKR
ncbi:MAG: fibronectin type III domain-containing protein, partial [Bacteroidales bacterium]|nr:fibronectin type III domain-containing protein [Bacteroidales bacterium]